MSFAMKFKSLLLCCCVFAVGCETVEVVNGVEVNQDEERKQRVEARVNAAKQYIEMGNYDRARVHLSRALEEDDKSPDVYEGLALVFQRSGEIKLAEEHYQKAMKYGGKNSRIMNNYAWFLFNKGEHQQAYELQKQVIEDVFYENRPIALYNKGLMELKLGMKSEAERSFVRAKSAKQSFAAPYLELADLYFQQQNYAEANKALTQYRNLVPHTSRSTWLGIQLARIFGDKQHEKSLALMMQNKFSQTNEFLLYKQSLRDMQQKNN